jgi:uncharacterized delta-60 repeat protein
MHRSFRARQLNLGRLWLAVASAIVLVVVWGDPAWAAPGDLDPTFGGDGWVFTLATQRDTAGAMAIQPDGKIIVVGSWGSRLATWRYLPSGRLDQTFGEDGSRTVGIDYHKLLVNDLVLQPDGRIVVGGQIGRGAMIARLTPEGLLDPTFGGGDGVLTIYPPMRHHLTMSAFAVRMFPDGGILTEVIRLAGYYRARSFLTRLSPDGSLDSAFGTSGKLHVGEGVASIAVDDTGILAAGPDPDSMHRVIVTRYLMDGTMDTTFGAGGTGRYSLGPDADNTRVTGIATDGLGRILLAAAGDFNCFAGPTTVLRLTTDGQRDPDFTPFRSCFEAASLHPAADGSVLVVGSVFAGGGSGEYYMWLMKLLPNGTPDSTFGDAGTIVATPEPFYWMRVDGADLQSDGKIVVLARASYQPAFLLARFLAAEGNSVQAPSSQCRHRRKNN